MARQTDARMLAFKTATRGRESKVPRVDNNHLFLDQSIDMFKPQHVMVYLFMMNAMIESTTKTKRSYSDQSVRGYITERTCWWNEVCKEEFQTLFRCKCPSWSYCRSPGKYYNAVCSMTETGYIWDQPNSQWRGQ